MGFIQMYREKFMRFPEGKTKAVTFSYDDGVVADRRLLSVFAKYGFKGTFNLNSECYESEYAEWHGRMSESDTFALFKDCGQEIALHGARHIFMTKVSVPEMVREIVLNKQYLEEKYQRIVRGFGYAYGAYNDDVIAALKMAGVKYARTTKSTHAFGIPENWLTLNPTCAHRETELAALTDKFIAARPDAELKSREALLFYIWGHSYEFDDHDNWHILDGLGEKLAGRSDTWFATNGEIYDYVQAYDRLEYSLDGEIVKNPSCMPVWVELRGRTYRVDAGEELKFKL